MKFLTSLLICLILAEVGRAASAFPGLKAILSPAEWTRAGLDQLTPDQIGVIDAALIRHGVETARLATLPPPGPGEVAAGSTPAENAIARSRFWDRFGIAKLTGDWRSQPPMVAKVTAWQGANRFVLDTGQVWEGVEPIPYEIVGRQITIEARPMDAFALKAGEDSLAVRVRRVR